MENTWGSNPNVAWYSLRDILQKWHRLKAEDVGFLWSFEAYRHIQQAKLSTGHIQPVNTCKKHDYSHVGRSVTHVQWCFKPDANLHVSVFMDNAVLMISRYCFDKQFRLLYWHISLTAQTCGCNYFCRVLIITQTSVELKLFWVCSHLRVHECMMVY